MKYFIAAKSLIGRVRKKNEDNLCIDAESLPLSHGDTLLISKNLANYSTHLVGVFDGMGGYSDGEKASHLAASTACKYLRRLDSENDKARILTELCLEANDKVCDVADGSRMGTTCALLCLSGNNYTVCNVGDSPIFLFREKMMKQISVDHNQKDTYEKVTGRLAEPRQKFKLTQCIGIPKDEMLIEPFTDSGRVQDGDVFLLCSDGITDMLSIDMIRQIIYGSKTAEKIVEELTETAFLAGGRDNITVLCVKAEGLASSAKRIWQWLMG